MSPGKVSLDALLGALERWEEMLVKYERSKDAAGGNRVLAEDIKMAALETMVPNELEQHLQLNATRFTTYSEMRAEVLAFCEARAGSKVREQPFKPSGGNNRGDDPMDVDALDRSEVVCHNCHKKGHYKRDCRQPGGGAHGGSGSSSSSSWSGSSWSSKSGSKGGWHDKGGSSSTNDGKKGSKGKGGKGKGKFKGKGKGKKGKGKGKGLSSIEEEADVTQWGWSDEK